MRRALFMLTALALVTTLVSTEAQAGWFRKDKDKDKTETKQIHRYDNFPPLTFNVGVLNRDARTGWQVGDLNIQFAKDCRMDADKGVLPELREGSMARVMGPRFGDTILAYRVHMVKPDYMNQGNQSKSQVIWSNMDPTVGEGLPGNPE